MSRGGERLTTETIVDQALKLVDDEGLESLSMRRLAACLGVEAMSIYNYLPGKEALLRALVERLLEQIEGPDDSLPWQQRVQVGFAALRQLLIAHPRAIPLFVGPPRWTDRGLELAEQLLVVLHEGGLDTDGSIQAHRILLSYTIGYAIVEAALGDSSTLLDAAAAPEGLDETRFPELATMFRDLAPTELEETFDVGLRLIIDGFDRRRTPATR